MHHVKVKRFLDSEQIQVYKKQVGRDRLEDGLEHAYLYTKVCPKGMSFIDSPIYDFKKMEWVRQISDSNKSESLRVSRSRTISKVYDIARSNMWEYFFTLTFNPEKVDSYDYSEVVKKLSKWLNNLRAICPGMKYIVVPEKHKSGRWHFHGLFADVDGLQFLDSGYVSESGQVIYNVGNYKLGFSTAVRLDGSPKVVSYLCKYITKEVCESTKGKKRYWASRNVKLPEVIEFDVDMKMSEILSCCDVDNGHIKTVEGYISVSYIDAPIYSTNLERFREMYSNKKIE